MCTGTTQTFSEEIQKSSEQNGTTATLHSIDKEIAAIKSQIDVLKSQGLKNLSKEERIEFGSLTKQLFAAQREKSALQKMMIAEEKKKQQAYERVNKKLDSIGNNLTSEKAAN